MATTYTIQIVLYHLVMLATVFFLRDRLRVRWCRADRRNEDDRDAEDRNGKNDKPRPPVGFRVPTVTKTLASIFLYGFYGLCTAAVFAVVVGIVTTGEISGQRFAEGLFFEGALFLSLAAATAMKRHPGAASQRFVCAALNVCATCLAAIGVDALYYEPRAIETKTYVVRSDRITRPLKIVFIADIQTDCVTPYEYRAMTLAKSLGGDLVLFGGDYRQSYRGGYEKSVEDLRRLFQETDFRAPLGVYAVAGNHEDAFPDWTNIFDGTGIEAVDETCVVPLKNGPDTILLEMLNVNDSRNVNWKSGSSRMRERATENNGETENRPFSIVLGHVPSFARSATPGDLLLAGHTHGGQVCIPGFGPIVTLTPGIPTSWGYGLTKLPRGGTLIVTNGVGMERREAPRIRFCCPPQIVVVEIVPGTPGNPDF